MLIYEVTVAVDAEVADAYRAWLGPHIGQVLAVGGFERADCYRLDDQAGRQRWCVHYHVADRAALQTYFDEHAAGLRSDGRARFEGRFDIARRVLEHETAFAPAS